MQMLNDYEYLHAGRSFRSARSEQQSGSLNSRASRLTLMAPRGPSKSHKSLFMKEMLVGAVGIEPTTFGLKAAALPLSYAPKVVDSSEVIKKSTAPKLCSGFFDNLR